MELQAYRKRNHASKIEAICFSAGYEPTIICTPEELMESDYENNDD